METPLPDRNISCVLGISMPARSQYCTFCTELSCPEIYVSISHLCDQFDYKIEINHDSLLFRYITYRLDDKVLETLKSRINNYNGKSISINLNYS